MTDHADSFEAGDDAPYWLDEGHTAATSATFRPFERATEPQKGAWYLVDGETGLPIRRLRPDEIPPFDPPQMLPPPNLPDYRGILTDRLRRLGTPAVELRPEAL